MTEYWKSQARKYCDFCKCWFADNKVSISFHENGKRHKENVQKHISQLSKKSAKEFKQKEKIDDDIKKMETAAMAAYLNDVKNNADITSQNINELLNQSGSSDTAIVVGTTPVSKAAPTWEEVKSEDGSSYYWNTVTNETTWDTPDEYVSVADQEKNKLKDDIQDKKKQKLKKQQQKQAQKDVHMEVNAHIARERMRELAVNKDPPPVKMFVDFGPAPRATKPYGSWTPVVNEQLDLVLSRRSGVSVCTGEEGLQPVDSSHPPLAVSVDDVTPPLPLPATVDAQPVEYIDLQLPKSEKELPPPPVIVQPEIIQFKEKRVESLGDEPVEFKKRKFNNPKRNLRQKVDDD